MEWIFRPLVTLGGAQVSVAKLLAFVLAVVAIARPIKVGDWIDVDGTGGRVNRIGARSTTILTSDNITMIVPNSELVTQRLTNWSHGDPTVPFRIPVGVAYGSDLEVVRGAAGAAFRRHGVAIPFPQRDVHFRSGVIRVEAGDSTTRSL